MSCLPAGDLAIGGNHVLEVDVDYLLSRIEDRDRRTVVEEVREAAQDEFALNADGELLTALDHHPPAVNEIPPMIHIPLGTRVRITGICSRTETKSVVVGGEVPFNILLRSFDDITVVARPSPLNIRNLQQYVI